MLDVRKPAVENEGSSQVLRLLKMLATFHLVALAWIFFPPGSFENSMAYLGGLLGLVSPTAPVAGVDTEMLTRALLPVLALVFLVDIPQYKRKDPCAILQWPYPRRVLGFTVFAVWIVMTRGTESAAFIYFQF